MQPLSPNYKSDDPTGLDPEIRKYLDEHYLMQLDNITVNNPKLLVVFSGGNAVGKSTIAQHIKEQFHALILENDEVKRALLERSPDYSREELSKLSWRYSMELYTRLSDLTSNGLVVRDSVIDWYFDRILPVFEKAGYALFIIGFDISRNKAIELIKARGDTPTVKEERFYVLLEDHDIHIKRFREHYTPDVLLTDDTIFNHQLVIDALEKRLQSMPLQSGV